jgi:hypothetical protein
MAETYMLDQMYFMCEPKKRKSKKNIYRVLVDGKQIKLKSSRIYIPFGGELYNDKIVLNIEVDPEKNNEHHNFYAKLSQIDIAFRDIECSNDLDKTHNLIPVQMLNDIKGKEFVSCIRNGKNGYIVRTHVKNGMTPCSYDSKELYTMTQLKNMYGIVELELYGLWTSSSSYGYIWYASDVTIT